VHDWQLIAQVATEAVDESDAIERHPEIIDLLNNLADQPTLNEAFGSNGHDPAAFVRALAEGLEPYRHAPLEDNPELVANLGLLAQRLREHAQQPTG
jgi:hypothetical protein